MTTLLLLALAAPQEALHERLERACVEVLVDGRLQGSGWFASAEGRVVTAAHYLDGDENRVELRSPALGRLKASIVAFDRNHDLALLAAPEREGAYPFLEIAPAMPAPPAEIRAFGSVMFRHGLLLPGRVARARPTFEYYADRKHAVRVFHVAAAAPKGLSGAPWVDGKGRVVGNQSGIMTSDGAATGIAFVAPPGPIRRLVESGESAETADARIAVEELWERDAAFRKRYPEGARGVVAAVSHIDAVPAPSLILSVDGRKVETRDAFYAAVRAKRPGESVALEVREPDAPEARRVEVRLVRLEASR